MLSQIDYDRIQPMVAANQAYMRKFAGVARQFYPHPEIGNAETGAVEQFELCRDKPDRFSAYLSSDRKVITWTGDVLAECVYNLSRWRDNFGGERVAFRFRMNGREYSARGIGEGGYLTARALKNSPR